jgi:hypothetical protein
LIVGKGPPGGPFRGALSYDQFEEDKRLTEG